MRLYVDENYPIRCYMDDSDSNIVSVSQVIKSRFYVEDDYNEGDELDTLVFADEQGNAWCPLGIYPVIIDACNALGIPVENEVPKKDDMQDVDCPDDILEDRTLRDYQKYCVDMALKFKKGIIQSGTGSGKTSMIAACVQWLHDHTYGNIVVLVPTVNLLLQTQKEFAGMGIEAGCYGGGYGFPGTRIIISTVQTMYMRLCKSKDDDICVWKVGIRGVLLDEAQHAPASTVSSVLDELQCEYMLGFSAEPFKMEDKSKIRDLMIRGILGPIIHKVEFNDLVRGGFISKPYVYMIKSGCPYPAFDILNWQWCQKNLIVDNTMRNNLIVKSADELINMGKLPLIIVSQIKHGEELAKRLSGVGATVCFCKGGQSNTLYRDGCVIDYVKDTNEVKEQVRIGRINAIIGTSTLDEGYDLSGIRAVILAGGGKSKLKTIQRIGRGLRISTDDPERITVVIDFQDNFNLVTRSHGKKRAKVYVENGFTLRYCDSVESFLSKLAFDRIERRRELGL